MKTFFAGFVLGAGLTAFTGWYFLFARKNGHVQHAQDVTASALQSATDLVQAKLLAWHLTAGDIQEGRVPWNKLKGATPMELIQKVRAGFLLGGVDAVGWPGGLVSGVHGGREVDQTVSAFENTLRMLADEGELE